MEPKSLLEKTLDNLPEFAREAVHETAALYELSQTRHSIEPDLYPIIYQMETTAICNLACPFCPRTTDLVPNKVRDMTATMDVKDMEKILDQMPWLESIELFHFGEPFAHKNFEHYVKACADRGIYTVIASNMLLASVAKVDRVFEAGLDFLVMDIDSLDPEKYAAARVGGNLIRLKERVEYALNHPLRPFTVAQTIMLDGKKEYTAKEFKAWTSRGVKMPDEIRYKFLDSFRGEADKAGVLQPEGLCREAFYGFSVHANGNVVPCDRDWGGENVMGNLHENTVADIWNGEAFDEFRRRMKSTDKPDMCKGCKEGALVNLRSQRHIQVNMFRGEEVWHD